MTDKSSPPPDESPADHPPPDPPPPDQPPPYQGPYGQAPGAPPYGQPPGQPPPGDYYGQGWGYGPPGVPYGMPQQAQGEETTWAIFAYVGMVLIDFIAPLIIYCVKKHDSPFTRFHAAQALNLRITQLIHLLAVAVVCVPPAIALTPWFLIPLIVPYLELVFGTWVFIILGAVKAGKSQIYRFPTFFCFRMVR